MKEQIKAVEEEVLGWLGVTSEPGRFGATTFRYGKREIGHIHSDSIADLPVGIERRDELLAKGRARPHRAGSAGYVSYPLESGEDVSGVLEILGENHKRAEAAAQRRAVSQGGEG